MKYIRYWLKKEVLKTYNKVQISGIPQEKANVKLEKYADESRRRIQDLELVVKEMAFKIDQMKYLLNDPGRH